MRIVFSIVIFVCHVTIVFAKIINVPADVVTIQEAIDVSVDGDTILVSPGTYVENLVIPDKSIFLSSTFFLTADYSDVLNTIIDGDDDDFVIQIEESENQPMTICGFTIQNADDGITPDAKFNIMHCRITGCTDGIDYESGSGGICSNNTFENNSDDGIDLDDDVDIIIEKNSILNNEDDGIEIRLQSYNGPTVSCLIKNNIISGNEEDGIQIIDYDNLSQRVIKIYNNLLVNNTVAGIGCMSDGNTTEDYEGAPVEEPIVVINNTFWGNEYGISGGANMDVRNNIIVNCNETAFKNVNMNSEIFYCCVWDNGLDFDNCNVNEQTILTADPEFADNVSYYLSEDSVCIDAGDPDETYNDPYDPAHTDMAFSPAQGTVLNDLGAYGGPYAKDWNADNPVTSDVSRASEFFKPAHYFLYQNYPNPFNPLTTIAFSLSKAADIKIDIFNLLGQHITTLGQGYFDVGYHRLVWNAAGRQSGIYYYRILSTEFIETKKMILLK